GDIRSKKATLWRLKTHIASSQICLSVAVHVALNLNSVTFIFACPVSIGNPSSVGRVNRSSQAVIAARVNIYIGIDKFVYFRIGRGFNVVNLRENYPWVTFRVHRREPLPQVLSLLSKPV